MKKRNRLLKWLVIGILAFFALISLIPVVFKKQIVNYVKKEINASVNAKVDFSAVNFSFFKFFPDFSLKIKNLSVVGTGDFEEDTLFWAKKTFIGLNLKNLIFDNDLIIKDIRIDDFVLNVKILRNGKANYDIAPEEPETAQDTTTAVDTTMIALKKVILKKGRILYNDLESQILVSLQNIDFFLKGDFSEVKSNLTTQLSADNFNVIYENINYVKQANLSYKGEIATNLDSSLYIFENNSLKINELGLTFNGFVQLLDNDDIKMDLNFQSSQTQFKALLSLIPSIYYNYFDGLRAGGSFKINGNIKGVYNDNVIPAYFINLQVNNAYFGFKDLPQDITDININATAQGFGSYENYSVKVKNFSARSKQNTLSGNLQLQSGKNFLRTKGYLSANVDFSTVKDFYPLENMKFSGLLKTAVNFDIPDILSENFEQTQISGNLQLKNFDAQIENYPHISVDNLNLDFSPNASKINSFDLKYGKSDFQITGTLKNLFAYLFSDEVLQGDFSVKSGFIDVNQLIYYEENNETAQQPETQPQENDTLAFEIPGNIDFALNIDINKAKYDKLLLEDLKGKIGLKNSKAFLENIVFKTLDGTVKLSGSYDAKNYLNPSADLNFDIKDIKISEIGKSIDIIDTLAPILNEIEGKTSLGLNLSFSMDYKLDPQLRTMNGEGYLQTKSIGIQENQIFKVLAKTTGNKNFLKPTLEDLNLHFKISNGCIHIPRTDFKLAGSESFLEGDTYLDRSINFKFGLKLRPENASKVISLPLEGLRDNIMVILQIGGTIDDPKIIKFGTNLTPSIVVNKTGLSEAGKAYLENVRKQAEEIIKEAEHQRDELINNAYKQADEIRNNARKQAEKILNEAREKIKPYEAKLKNPALKKWAQKQIDKIMKKAKKQADKIIDNANKDADKIIADARKQGDKIVANARKRADKMIKDAEEKAKKM